MNKKSNKGKRMKIKTSTKTSALNKSRGNKDYFIKFETPVSEKDLKNYTPLRYRSNKSS